MAKHSRIGASTAPRWLACPGSVSLCDTFPTPPVSVYADQGTAAHWVIEECLKNDDDPMNFVDETCPLEYLDHEIVLTEEDCQAVSEFLKTVNKIRSEGSWILHSEVKFHLKAIDEELFGTSDIVLISSDLKRLKVIDYKHGAGVPVIVENNRQVMYYSLGAILEVCEHHNIPLSLLGWGGVFDEVELIIGQPRCRLVDSVQRWVVPSETLDEYAETLRSGAQLTRNPKAPLHAGDHCRWCPALSECPEHMRRIRKLAQHDFTKADPIESLPVPDTLTLEAKVNIYKHKESITAWLSAIGNDLNQRLLSGDSDPELVSSFKLVKKKSNRMWSDEDIAYERLEMLLDRPTLLKLRTPAQIEKALKTNGQDKSIVEDLVYKPDNGTTMASIDDRRPAVSLPKPSDEFERIV